MKTFLGLTDKGLVNLKAILDRETKDPESHSLSAWAQAVRQDGDEVDVYGHLEISEFYTKSGNPFVVTFSDDEIFVTEEEDV